MDENSFVTMRLHAEFEKRMEEEHKRINHRIAILDKLYEQNQEMLLAIKTMTISMQNMQEELGEQGKRLETLESRDGEMWRKVVGHVVTAVIGLVIGFIFNQIGM